MKKLFLLSAMGTLLLTTPALAQTVDNSSDVQVVNVEATVPADTNSANTGSQSDVQPLDGVTVSAPTSVPSGFGLFWRGLREQVSLLTTFNPVKKAEKQLQFAEERLQIAKTMSEKSTDPAVQAKAADMVAKANDFIQRIEDKKEAWANNKDAATQQLIKNIITHEFNREKILTKLENKLPEEEAKKIQESRQQSLEQGKRLLNALTNEHIPADVKEHLQQVKDQIEQHAAEVEKFQKQAEALREQIKNGDENAKEALEKLHQDRQEQMKANFEQRKEDLGDVKDLREKMQKGDSDVSSTLRIMKKGLREMMGGEPANTDRSSDKGQENDGNEDNNRPLPPELEKQVQDKLQQLKLNEANPESALREAIRMKALSEQKRLEVEKRIQEMEQEQ